MKNAFADRPVVMMTVDELRTVVAEELQRIIDAKTAPPPADWLSRDAAAAFVGVKPRTLVRMAKRGELPVSHVGRKPRFRRADLEAFLAGTRRAA